MAAKARFAVSLALGSLFGLGHFVSAPARQAPAAGQIASIRDLDFESLLEERFRKEHKGATMEEICEDMGREEIDLMDSVFGDLDGDGKEEAAVMAFSCLAGTSGPDLTAVYKLQADGKVIELPIAFPSQEEAYRGLDTKEVSLRLGEIRIEKQTYFETYTIWGGSKLQVREFAFQWDGHKLALVGTKDTTIR